MSFIMNSVNCIHGLPMFSGCNLCGTASIVATHSCNQGVVFDLQQRIAELERQLKVKEETLQAWHVMLDGRERRISDLGVENAALKEENERLKHSHDYLTKLSKDLLMEIEGLKAGPGTSLRDLK